MKKIRIIFVVFILLISLISCSNNKNTTNNNEDTSENKDKHNCSEYESDWIDTEELTCEKEIEQIKICTKCEKILDSKTFIRQHQYNEELVLEMNCEQDGYIKKTCQLCNKIENVIIYTEGHKTKEEIIKEPNCTENGITQIICINCDYVKTVVTKKLGHDFKVEQISTLSCTTDSIIKYECKNCDEVERETIYATGHKRGDAVVVKEPTSTELGYREFYCTECDELLNKQSYINNGYISNGKLSVDGADLVNQYGEKFQLYGLSTHGLQWFGRYANFDTIAAIQEGFGNNIIRFAFYTAENGYCEGDKAKKEQMLSDLIEGVDAATKLGLYVIIDWHMVGAESVADKNPLTYVEESKEFFRYISNYYKDQDNILYEIMNEPNGATTWADCKKYAEAVIPCIRENSDGIILVGNPKWTADLNSVMKNPLVGYTNIMYTYHFYAADHSSTYQVEKAYDAGFPVFISEFGFMDSSGDGSISEKNGNKWKEVLDSRNISYVAWNISNSKGSASIFKYGSTDMTSVEDNNLKIWGVYLKNWYREKSKLDDLL